MTGPLVITLDGGLPAEVHEELDSTNAEALRRIRAGTAREGWIMARAQSNGRGRRGRDWVSRSGNLFTSRLLLARCPRAHAPELSFVAALAVRDTIVASLPADLDVTCKWPNDVLVNGAKVAGILLESEGNGSLAEWIVIGIGINVASAPRNVMFRATSLAEHGADTTPDALLARLSRNLDHWVAIWQQGGFSPIREAWLGVAARFGDSLTVGTGADRVTGRFVDLDGQGGLVLELPDGRTRTISAGDVFF